MKNTGSGFEIMDPVDLGDFSCEAANIPAEKGLRTNDFNGDGLDDLLCHDRDGKITVAFNTFSKWLLEFFTHAHSSLFWKQLRRLIH